MQPFNLGDIVQLKTGGPDMRVIGFSPNGRVWCDWDSGIIDWKNEGSFVPESLAKTT